MTGLPGYNFPAFEEATRRLRAIGHRVISPAEHDEDAGWVEIERDDFGGILDVRKLASFDWQEALAWDVDAIGSCDGVYFLPGWSRSRGACKEYEAAKRLGLLVLGAVAETPLVPVEQQPLVGLVGYAQSGKDTFAQYLGYQRLAFADALKELALAAHPALRMSVPEKGWEWVKKDLPGGREFLQDLGVGVRDVLGADTWVRAAFAKYDPTLPTVFTDVRFPNEIEAIRGRGGVIVRIERVGHQPPNNHVSEFAWQSTEPDFVIRAESGDLKGLSLQAYLLDADLREQ